MCSAQLLPLWLWPGLIGGLGGLGWLYWRGIRRGRWIWSLAGLAVAWASGVTLVTTSWWPPGLLVLSLAFAGSVGLMSWLIWRESSQRVEIDRLRRLAEAPSDRIAALGHDIKTPLTIIKGRADQLLEGTPGPLTSQQLAFLQVISRECETTIALAKDLLIQAQIEAGLFKLRLEPVDLKALAQQVVGDMRALADDHQQCINLDGPQVMERIQADPRRLKQVLTNLLQNASRYTSQGGHIYVTIADNEAAAVVSVMDDGAGLSAEERRQLFRKFVSSRQGGEGTGLGLVISRQIIELHGGQILVDANLGRGTTVLFTLPRRKEPNTYGPIHLSGPKRGAPGPTARAGG